MRFFEKASSKNSLNLARFGAGFGMGLLGALALAVRFGWKHQRRRPLSDAISPPVFATRMLKTSSGEIVYHTSGTGEPLLFLHGVFPGASSFEWSKVYPHFASDYRPLSKLAAGSGEQGATAHRRGMYRGILDEASTDATQLSTSAVEFRKRSYQVLVPDLIGFGESQRPRTALSAESQTRSLAEFLRSTTGGKAVTLVASGLSANLALLLAARYPNEISRLILCVPFLALKTSSSFRPFHRLSWFPRLARIVYRRQLSTEHDIKQWLLRSGFGIHDGSLEEAVTVLSSTAQQYGAEHAFLAQCSHSFWRNLSSQLTSLHLPMSLLSNKNSERLTNESIAALRPYATRFSINEMETESSLPSLTSPELVITALRQELESNG